MVINKIDKIRRDFLWHGSSINMRKIHLLNWEMVCKSKNKGALGISSIMKRNVALLAKWWWKHRVEADKLWAKVLKRTYGDIDNLKFGPRSSVSSIMSSILHTKEYQEIKIIFER